MSGCNDIDGILKRNGTGQNQRFIEDLDPDNFQLQDFDVEDWILFAFNFAKNINYFESSNDSVVAGDWQDFFNIFNITDPDIPLRSSLEYNKLKANITKVISGFEEEGKLTPHLTLFVCFAKLLDITNKQFNKLSKRHYDFYLKEILQVDNHSFTPDKVHAVFELAKKSNNILIEENTELKASKDANGNQIVFDTNEAIIANQACVASLKTVYNSSELRELKSSANGKTLDGIEEELTDDQPYWHPFGYPSETDGYTDLQDAKFGFSIASPLFSLKEGARKVLVTIDFESEPEPELPQDFFPEIETNIRTNLRNISSTQIKNTVKVFGSGEEDWIQAKVNAASKYDEGFIPLEQDYLSEATQDQLKIAFTFTRELDSIINYDSDVLSENYNTKYPVVRFLIDTGTNYPYEIHRALFKRKVKRISIKTYVRDIRDVEIENDFGKIKSTKPFYPFTSLPIKSSNFQLDYPEMFSKNWKVIRVFLNWKDKPQNLSSWYTGISNLVDNDYFTLRKSVLNKKRWTTTGSPVKYLKTNQCVLRYENESEEFEIKNAGPLRATMLQSLFHNEFPNIFTQAILTDLPPTTLPNKPYTPQVESISLNYTAEESLEINTTSSQSSFKNNRIQLFHEHPFGQNEEHKYLKTKKHNAGIRDVHDTNTVNTFLIPTYCDGGELYIGLKNAEVKRTVTLLIQAFEGSENPSAETFGPKELINWSILCDNKWKSLKDDIISNGTNNFLSSGIIKFNIPKEATDNNTLLPEGMMWVKASMHKPFDAVCKIYDVHAQAVEAIFVNNDNEVSHLEKGLPTETIKKLITRIPQVKSITQPYNSFGGKPEESDAVFYRRISERIRHKNRTISLWDYEHIILQEFPEIYKVKCLNHTSETSFNSPGNVTIVVIPDTVNKIVYDVFQPQVGIATINKVKNHINALNTMLVTADVINPVYEEVEIALEVKIHEGFDEVFYMNQLNADIIKYLSPWAFDSTQSVDFGGELHRSVIINFIEHLNYVDYIQQFRMKKDGEISNKKIAPTNPKAILVSAKSHNISTVLTTCDGDNTQIITEECQI